MKDFVLIFRNSANTDAKPSPEQMQQVLTKWMDWMAGIAAQNKMTDRGNRLSMSEGKTVGADNVVTDGPYTELKEFINGYIIVKTETIDEAVELAKGCPILQMGGKVEVRAVVTPDDNS
ncbi:YciI family protein [Flavobacterium sp. MFBS3-15]|uniref:YciI family protein n=1 Tax=Flavobacterium sp. MFBS3-15 TaxID=2989816 RepID=UPI0022363C24|nr:YciI family protein [Flavobacterium sp. MFBS3-15]MCW4469703.1 YciI family protein [Flavobacterium sp. MFBS3-15]